jgi:hypothetical protein
VRTALQRHLTGRLSTNGASFTRFVFGLPMAVVYLVAMVIALMLGGFVLGIVIAIATGNLSGNLV